MKHNVPQIVYIEAQNQGFSNVSYAGELDGADVYSVGNLDKEGNPIPDGLPSYVLFKDGKTKFVSGPDGLKLLFRL